MDLRDVVSKKINNLLFVTVYRIFVLNSGSIYNNWVMSSTPIGLSTLKPSPYLVLIILPN